MFLRHLDFLFKPFREARAKEVAARGLKGSVQLDVDRVRQMGQQGRDAAGQVRNYGQGQHAAGGAHNAMNPMGPSGGAPAMPGAPGGGINPNPPIKKVGFLFKKKVCTQCQQTLDKTWDSCPYCAQAAGGAQPKGPLKTQAFMLDASGGPGMQLMGWIIPLQGPQRGELYTLAPTSSIGTDPGCTVVLLDKFMSAKHAEIRAEGGVWMLKDLGSTNGTYVNDKRVEKHELVDNDVVKFGGSLVKFKSL